MKGGEGERTQNREGENKWWEIPVANGIIQRGQKKKKQAHNIWTKGNCKRKATKGEGSTVATQVGKPKPICGKRKADEERIFKTEGKYQ